MLKEKTNNWLGRIGTVTLLLGGFSFSTITYANYENYPRRAKLERRAQKVSNKINRVLNNNMYQMSNNELQDFIRATRSAIQIARGNGGGHGGGGNNGGYGTVIKVDITNTSFILEGRGLENIRHSCINKIKRLSSRDAYSVKVSVNRGRTVSKTSSVWWKTPVEKCSAILNAAIESAKSSNVSLSNKTYVLNGEGGGYGIIASGNSLRELESSCARLNEFSRDIYSLSVSLNGGPKKKRSSSYWWKTNAAVCNAAIAAVF